MFFFAHDVFSHAAAFAVYVHIGQFDGVVWEGFVSLVRLATIPPTAEDVLAILRSAKMHFAEGTLLRSARKVIRIVPDEHEHPLGELGDPTVEGDVTGWASSAGQATSVLLQSELRDKETPAVADAQAGKDTHAEEETVPDTPNRVWEGGGLGGAIKMGIGEKKRIHPQTEGHLHTKIAANIHQKFHSYCFCQSGSQRLCTFSFDTPDHRLWQMHVTKHLPAFVIKWER